METKKSKEFTEKSKELFVITKNIFIFAPLQQAFAQPLKFGQIKTGKFCFFNRNMPIKEKPS
ncbi:MAG: hypothetical protein FWC34_03505 [Bacteroidetes bacterium]|nr:hypothetical protein [Bacteroidota bacterium]MCL2302433.1 hypothetical protein [Lentimicrobiaceae bacterium]